MSKTPVSILQEYCTRQMLLPQYDLVVNGVGSHNPLFVYKVTVGEVATYGEGKSKKEAKHEAARLALGALPIDQSLLRDPVVSFFHQPEVKEQSEDITSPYHGALKENAIGELISICSNNQLPEPIYKLSGEEGQPHAKIFTFECHVGNLKETGTFRTKKQAKHLSAKLMIERLKTMLGSKLDLSFPEQPKSEPEVVDEVDEKAKSAYSVIQKKKKINENFNLPISDYHKVDLKILFIDKEDILDKLAVYDENNFSVDAVELLNSLVNETEVSVIYNCLLSVSSSQTCVVCELDYSPYFVTCCVEYDSSKAKQMAAHRMLSLIKLFIFTNM